MSSDTVYYPVEVVWDEECSGFEPGARYNYGGDYYTVEVRASVPLYIEELGLTEEYIDNLMMEDFYIQSSQVGLFSL